MEGTHGEGVNAGSGGGTGDDPGGGVHFSRRVEVCARGGVIAAPEAASFRLAARPTGLLLAALGELVAPPLGLNLEAVE